MNKETTLALKRKWVSCLFSLSRRLCYPLVYPYFFDIQITDLCNLKCIMCNSQQSIGSLDCSLLIDLLKQIDDFSKAKKVININGGEPLLYPKFKELSEYIGNNKRDTFWLITNGLLLDKFLAEVIKFDSLVVSIDGLKEANDLIRGSGVFEKVADNLKKMRDFVSKENIRLRITFNILITKYNYKDLFQLSRHLHDLYPNSGFTLLNIIQDNTNALLGQDGQLGFIDEPSRLKEEILKIKDFCAGAQSWLSYSRGYIDSLGSDRNPRAWKCFAGYNRLTVVATGDVWICDTALGNIKNNGLKRIWYSKKAGDFRKKVKRCNSQCFMDCYKDTFIF